MTSRQAYRPDIDGLRAISVIAVMIFHFFPSLLPGGFIGVDVFFVISGFLVTKSILNDLQTGGFSLKGFYSRRIRRIVPATLPVFIVCLIFGAIFTLTEDFSELGERALYSVGMIKNHFLSIKSDYFAQSPGSNPFTHFWSLSIEEQFYLIWAPMVYFTYRRFKNHFWALPVGIFLLSVTLNFVMIKIDPKLTFYFLPTRMWELAAGAVLCVLEKQLRFSHRQQNFVSGAALATLLATFVFISGGRSYPGYLALLPVLSAVLFISTPEAFLNRVLSGKVAVTVGLMSYSLYLWHWPVLSFFNMLFPSQLTAADLIILFIATFFISYLSYVRIEAPALKIPELRAARNLMIGVAAVFVFAGIIAAGDGKIILHPKLEKSAEAVEDYDGEYHLMPDFCKGSGIKYCILSDPKKPPTIALMGDSHASHWFPGLRDLTNAKNENLLLLVQEQTPPLLSVKTTYKKFTDMTEAFRIASETPTIHTVILSAFWPVYANEQSTRIGKEYSKIHIQHPSVKNFTQEMTFTVLLGKTVRTLLGAGKKVIFLHDVPSLPFLGDQFMPRPHFETGFPICAFEDHLCTFPYEHVKTSQMIYRRSVDRVIRKFPGFKVIDPVPMFCDEGSGNCLSHPHGKMVYWDEHQIGFEGSKFLVPKLFKSEL